MMRSLYSAVSGLKTHQTKMDVVGNNISNVNTVAFKSSSVTFSDVMYQTTSNASGANGTTGTGGVNAKQIGLGVTAAATRVSITTAGATESTGNPFDLKLTDANSTNFFVVNNGTENVFTRDGSFYIDGVGNLCMSGTGYTVMGWQVDKETNTIMKDTVTPLRVMQENNLTSSAEKTTDATVGGVFDVNDANLKSDAGLAKNLIFYDDLGYSYTARFIYRNTDTKGEYSVELASILDSNGTNVYDKNAGNITFKDPADPTGATNKTIPATDLFGATSNITRIPAQAGYTYVNDTGALGLGDGYLKDGKFYKMTLSGTTETWNSYNWDTATGSVLDATATPVDTTLKKFLGFPDSAIVDPTTVAADGSVTGQMINFTVKFNTSDGTFDYVGQPNSDDVTLKLSVLGGNFSDVKIDFTQCKDSNNNGSSTISMEKGTVEDSSIGAGKKLGTMTGISIDTNGKVYGTYSNGNTELLGQVAVAQFSNAAGLEKMGDNCYTTTLNSGEFDGIGVEISADGSKMTSGQLEMSNVDLSTEFTQMIITQRGFQANSRIITVSDTLLEELINLKR